MLAAIFITGQAVYWLILKPNTEFLDDLTWNACLFPGGQCQQK